MAQFPDSYDGAAANGVQRCLLSLQHRRNAQCKSVLITGLLKRRFTVQWLPSYLVLLSTLVGFSTRVSNIPIGVVVLSVVLSNPLRK
jgi:hypothetical protein